MTDSAEETYPDLFFDGVHVTVTIYGANMTFTLSNPHPKDQSDALKVKNVIPQW